MEIKFARLTFSFCYEQRISLESVLECNKILPKKTMKIKGAI